MSSLHSKLKGAILGVRRTQWQTEHFGYESVEELAKLNRMRDLATWDGSTDILLPGWSFFHARNEEFLPLLDEMFQQPDDSVRTVGRAHRADARLPYKGEIIAVPDHLRAKVLKTVR